MRRTQLICLMFIFGFIIGFAPQGILTSNNTSFSMKDTYMVEMRDGIHLATEVYLPDDMSGPHPSILIRTPYDKSGMNMGGWADVGWPTIVQDMRGRFASEGIDTVFRNAHTDGPDTLDWIDDQEWCDGQVITYGGSALGINQYYMAGANPEALKAQFIQVATPNLHKHAMFQGGQFRNSMVTMWLSGQNSLFVLPELIAHENYTLDFWTNTSLEDNWADIHVPAIHVGGWYDCFAQGTVDGFLGYQYLGGEGAKGKSKLIMGPWVHGASRYAGELVYPENAAPGLSWELFVSMIYEICTDEQYETEYDFLTWPAVSYYVMGDVDDIDAPGNEWRYANQWPIQSEQQEWYFHQNGILSQQTTEQTTSQSYLYDPTDPAPTKGGQNLCILNGPYDQTEVEDRDDVLVFTSEVLTEPYEATGPIKARLYVSSDCPDTDFTVKLTDVYPDGRSMLITDGIIRMRNRNGPDHWEFMESNEIYEVEVDLWSTSYIWNQGHQIRVSVSSSNFPRFLANPNTKDPIMGNTTYTVAENTILMDGETPSCIILPYIEKPVSNPPSTPPALIGPETIHYRKSYTFETTVFDPDGDKVYVLIDWNDGTNPGWIGPYQSGETVILEHTWQGMGEKTLDIRVKLKDIHDVQSEWSEPLHVSLPKKAPSSFLRIILYLYEFFPFLSKIPLFV